MLKPRKAISVDSRAVVLDWKEYAVRHKYVTYGVFNGYTGQLHVSAFTGHKNLDNKIARLAQQQTRTKTPKLKDLCNTCALSVYSRT